MCDFVGGALFRVSLCKMRRVHEQHRRNSDEGGTPQTRERAGHCSGAGSAKSEAAQGTL
jgi:hypothetical protein